MLKKSVMYIKSAFGDYTFKNLSERACSETATFNASKLITIIILKVMALRFDS